MGREVNRSWEDVKAEWDKKAAATGFAGFRYRTVDRYKVCRNRVREVPNQVKWAYQRVVRGWDDRALWSLDDQLSRSLGAQLTQMAKGGMSYPGTEVYPSFELWQTDLHKHGAALATYARVHYETDTTDEWELIYQPAREALMWVAENLGNLWD